MVKATYPVSIRIPEPLFSYLREVADYQDIYMSEAIVACIRCALPIKREKNDDWRLPMEVAEEKLRAETIRA